MPMPPTSRVMVPATPMNSVIATSIRSIAPRMVAMSKLRSASASSGWKFARRARLAVTLRSTSWLGAPGRTKTLSQATRSSSIPRRDSAVEAGMTSRRLSGRFVFMYWRPGLGTNTPISSKAWPLTRSVRPIACSGSPNRSSTAS